MNTSSKQYSTLFENFLTDNFITHFDTKSSDDKDAGIDSDRRTIDKVEVSEIKQSKYGPSVARLW